MLKKTLCLILVCVMVLTALPIAFAADEKCDCGRNPTIRIDGLNGVDLIRDKGTASERRAFPFDAAEIKDLILNNKEAVWDALDTNWSAESEETIIDAIVGLMPDIEMTSNGDSLFDITANWSAETLDDHKDGTLFNYSYDWRLDPFVNAAGLAEYIDDVRALTGHDKVDLIGESLGGTVLSTYLSVYGTEKVGGCIWFCGAQCGVYIADQAYQGNLYFDTQEVTSFLHEATPDTFEYQLISILMQALADLGVTGSVLKITNAIMKKFSETGGFRKLMLRTFGKMPGVWACVDDSAYDAAKDYMFPTAADKAENAGLIERIDRYHYEVQANLKEIMETAQRETGTIAVISHYGYHLAPVVPDSDVMSDRLIDSARTSCGATFARYGALLPEGERVSADRLVDASTAMFPDYTWIVRGLYHGEKPAAMRELFRFIFDAQGQPTVFDSDSYPQFLSFNRTTQLLSPLGEDEQKPPKLAARWREFVLQVIRWVKNLFLQVGSASGVSTGA